PGGPRSGDQRLTGTIFADDRAVAHYLAAIGDRQLARSTRTDRQATDGPGRCAAAGVAAGDRKPGLIADAVADPAVDAAHRAAVAEPQLASPDVEIARDAIGTGQHERAEVAFLEIAVAGQRRCDRRSIAGAGQRAVTDPDHRLRRGQRDRVAGQDIAVAGELQSRGGDRAAAAIDRH